MIVLDTNVIAEAMASTHSEAATAWLNAQSEADMYVTAVTEAEVRAGVAFLPAGKRRDGLAGVADKIFDETFRGRNLAFDAAAAPIYASIVAARRAGGRPIPPLDAQIAAIARLHRMSLATRNTTDFEGCGVALINPWGA